MPCCLTMKPDPSKRIDLATRVIMPLATGFEEIEALTVINVLKRTGVDAVTVSITGEKIVEGTHGIRVETDQLMEDAVFDRYRMIALPGGMPGATNLEACDFLLEKIREFASDEDKFVAAICAAPFVLATAGVLEGKCATIYPGMEDRLKGAAPTGEDVTVDGNIITGRGPGLAMKFALTLVEQLKGEPAAKEVAEGLLFKE